MEIYIKPLKKSVLASDAAIYVKDVTEVIAPGEVSAKVKSLKVAAFPPGKGKKNVLVNVTDIIRLIKHIYPKASIVNVGEMETLVQSQPAQNGLLKNPAFTWLRVCFVALVLLVGSATAIMTFNTDGQINKIFENYFRMFHAGRPVDTRVISIPYSIGLAVGILVFYNHFMGKKITDDPTPIEVEIEMYDNDVTDAMSDIISSQKDSKAKGGQG